MILSQSRSVLFRGRDGKDRNAESRATVLPDTVQPGLAASQSGFKAYVNAGRSRYDRASQGTIYGTQQGDRPIKVRRWKDEGVVA